MSRTTSLARVLVLALLIAGATIAPAAAAEPLFTSTVSFATKTGFRGVFAWQATRPVDAVVRYGTSPDALTQTTAALPGATDSAGLAIAEGLSIGSTIYWQVEDLGTGERSAIDSFRAVNAYNDWNGSTYTLNLLVQLDTQSLPPDVQADVAIENIAQGMNIFAERLYDATDGFARLGKVLVTDTNLDFGVNVPFLPPGCLAGLTNAADVLVQTSVPFDSHTFSGWSIEDPCISFYVGRIGQLVVPWGLGGSEEDLHFGYVSTHEMMHYAFNAPDLYNTSNPDDPAGCRNLAWDGSLMHNSGGWTGTRWELTELDRNATLTPCDHQHSAVYSWPELRTRYTNVPARVNGPIENILDTRARGNPDGGALDVRVLDREPSASTLRSFTPNDDTLYTNPCNEPGFTVLTDPSFDATGAQPAHDVAWAGIAEPFSLGSGRMVFLLKMRSLASLPPNTTWPILFRDQAGIDRWVRMATDLTGAVTFASGTGTNTSPAGGAGTPALASSGYGADGTIRIVVARAAVGNPAPGQSFTQFLVRIRQEAAASGATTPDNMPNSLARTGIYTVVGSENCRSLPPVAVDDDATTAEDTPVTVAVLANDSDPEGDPLSITSVGSPARGTAVATGASILYTPNTNTSGTDSFTYTVADGRGGSATARVTVDVTAVADAPQALDDRATIVNGTSIRIPVLDNDADADGDALGITLATDPPRGTSQANEDGTIRYTPDAGFSGTDTFDYTVTDGALTDTARVTVSVLPAGAANPCTLPGPTVVTDPANDHLDAADDMDIQAISAAGRLVDGQLVFTMRVQSPPNPPSASSVWRIQFRAPGGSVYYVSMETLDPLAPPAFRFGSVDGTFITDLGPADSGAIASGAGVGVITIGVKVARLGTVVPGATIDQISGRASRFVGAAATGGFVNVDTTGTGSFLIAACITEPPNDPPSAIDDIVVLNEDTQTVIDVRANDRDRNGDPITLTEWTAPEHGAIVPGPNGTLTYTPDMNFAGADTFAYTISDGRSTASARVDLTVSAVNDAPVALDDEAGGLEDQTLSLDPAVNDSDVDGDALTVTSVSAAANGIVTLGEDGSVTYVPNGDYHGGDSLTYTVEDGNGGSATAIVLVTLAPVNDAPDAADDAVDVPKNRSFTVSALANDRDVDGDQLTVTGNGQPQYGIARVNPDGTITYIPRKGSKLDDSFTYTISDGNGGSDTATIFVRITK